MSKALTIMLVKNRALGDSIMGLATVQYLKLLYPKSNIIYAVPQWIEALYGDTNIAADSIYPLKMDSLTDFIKLFKDLWRLKVDHVHEMHQSGRGAKFFKVICLLQGIRYTAHNHHLKTKTGVIDQGAILPLIQRDLDGVFSFLGKGTRPNFLDFTPIIVPKDKPNKAALIIFGLVATRQTKMWPLEYYTELGNLIHKKYPEYSIIIPLSKNAEDQKIKQKLNALGLSANTKIVELKLSELPSLIAKASIYIGNDTGLKHLAVAVGVKSYTFFGPEPINEWHPYNKDAHPYFYLENLNCRTRIHHYCGLSVCDLSDGNMHCLTIFKPTNVIAEVEKVL